LNGYIEFQFILLSIIVGNIIYFNNLVRRQTRKYILDFENILNITFCSLSELPFLNQRIGSSCNI